MKHLFAILVGEALEALSLEELTEYRDSLRAVAEKVHARDAEVIGDLSASDLLDQMREGVEAISLANARIDELTKDQPDPQALEDELATLAAEARGPEDPEDEPAEVEAEVVEDEFAAVEETEEPEDDTPADEPEGDEPAVTAATEPPPVPKLARPARSRASKPVEKTATKATLTASSEGLPGLAIGQEIPDELALAAAMISKRERFGHMTAREDVPIAKLDWRDDYPEERHLSAQDGPGLTQAKIEAVVASIFADPNKGTDKALIAAGGICAPLTPLYDLPVWSVSDRPVRAGLASFQADRGGITFSKGATLADISTAVGIVTAEEDGIGGTTALKTCQTIECAEFEDATIDILYHCVQTSNLPARIYPEQLAQFNQLVLAGFARMAEVNLLDQIRDASTAVTAASLGYGATGDFLGQVLAAASGMRNRHRMRPDTVLRVMLPAWAPALMVSDVVRSQFERFDTDEARVKALLRTYNVEPSFYIDGPTSDGQIFGAQTDGALLPFPDPVEWFLFPEGSFLFLDGGTLELGLVRDSVLNSTNEFQIFGESFEGLAFRGIESLAITSDLCDSGVVAAPGEITDCGDYSGN